MLATSKTWTQTLDHGPWTRTWTRTRDHGPWTRTLKTGTLKNL